MGLITTHVLDTARGKPGAGIRVDLYRDGSERTHLTSLCTNDDGRTDVPMLDDGAFETGTYELVFQVAEYLTDRGGQDGVPPFFDRVTLRFHAAEDAHYHVPLLLSPWSYSTYRGS